MATLTGNAINTSYQGLIKFDDNGAVDPTTLKQLTDGTGGSLPIQVSQVQTKFQSLVDFTDATVSGLPVAEAGLVNGTGTDSLKQADSLVTNAATASGPQSIAIGNGAVSNSNQSIAIGNYSEATSVGAAAVGEYASANALYASAWGRTSYARADGSVAFGQQAGVPFGVNGGVAMGRQVVADLADTTHVRALKIVAPDGGTGGNGITMLSPNGTAGLITLTDASELAVDGTPIGGGGGAAGLVAGGATGSQKSADAISDGSNSASGYRSIAIGSGNQANSSIGVAIGNYTRTGSAAVAIGDNANTSYGAKDNAVSIGRTANAETSAVAIGNQATASATGAVALGNGVTAATADTATVNLFQIAGYATMNYVDDAAAATGGIPLGGVYHTDGALKIRIA